MKNARRLEGGFAAKLGEVREMEIGEVAAGQLAVFFSECGWCLLCMERARSG